MKIVPKLLTAWSPLVLKSDNTRVVKPVIEKKIGYKLKPGESFFNDRGKKVIIKSKNETVSADTRSNYLKRLDLKKTLEVHKLHEELLKQQEGSKNLQGFLTFVSPSTYVGPVFNDNGKSYTENVLSGEGTGNAAGNVAIDLLTPFAISRAKSLVNATRSFPYRSSNYLDLGNNIYSSVSSPVYLTRIIDGVTFYHPYDLAQSYAAGGKEMAAKFFEHPVVKQSYAHNQELAQRVFGTQLPSKDDVALVVRQPVQVKFDNLGELVNANVALSWYGDPDAVITYNWRYTSPNSFKQASIHENLHRGFYSAPLRRETVQPDYYTKVFKPELAFYKWKYNKLFKPGYEDMAYGNYFSSPLDGEAGTNFIDLGRDLGLKLGLKYPGYETTKKMLSSYKGNKSFMIPLLNDTKAGMRHVWDAMTGKYFTLPAIGISTWKINQNL